MPFDLQVGADGLARFDSATVRCSVGRSGLSEDKREGDGATPVGSFACRYVLWRPDRLALPPTGLPSTALSPSDGWCDDPQDARYNRRVLLPYPAHAEALWRDDNVYTVIIPLGYNDDPVVPGRGSAIFLHVAREDYGPTAGCLALALPDLLRFLRGATPESRVIIRR